jgi:hypothetical protein
MIQVLYRWSNLFQHHVIDHYNALVRDNQDMDIWCGPDSTFGPLTWHYRWPRVAAALEVARRLWGAEMCRLFGCKVEVEDFVNATYKEWPDDGLDHPPVIEDIDGGGVDWHCTRCGRGGRSYF